MFYKNTLDEIKENVNTGVEYEIALFYALLSENSKEKNSVLKAIRSRKDKNKIMDIIEFTSISPILKELKKRKLLLEDVSFETQNDNVGPSDIVMYLKNDKGEQVNIGISVKYSNTCTLNVTGKNFITEKQIEKLQDELPSYTKLYIKEMAKLYGDVENWFRMRKPSKVTDKYIDLIRDEVIKNWPKVTKKTTLLKALFHKDSPIEFWVVTYKKNGFTLKTKPQTIKMNRAKDIEVRKYQTSYVGFYLDGKMVGHMQVKFNNGFLERCKKSTPDIVYQGVEMSFGHPFSSWNFCTEKE